MNEWVALGKRLRTMMLIRGITLDVLAKKTYLPDRALSLVIAGEFMATPDCWTKIRKTLNWPFWLDSVLDVIITATFDQAAPAVALWNTLTGAHNQPIAASDSQPPVPAQEPPSSPTAAAPVPQKETDTKPKRMGRPPKARNYVNEALRDVRQSGATGRIEPDEVSSAAENGSISGRVLG
ncbi:MAG: hypothetical protein ACYC6L_02550 [Anaerolineae bacterium]